MIYLPKLLDDLAKTNPDLLIQALRKNTDLVIAVHSREAVNKFLAEFDERMKMTEDCLDRLEKKMGVVFGPPKE